MPVENSSSSVDTFANQCADPALLYTPWPGEEQGELTDRGSTSSPRTGSFSVRPEPVEGPKDSYATVQPEDSKLLKYGAVAVGGGVVVAGLIFAPEITIPALLLGAAGCTTPANNDRRTPGTEGEGEGVVPPRETDAGQSPPETDGSTPGVTPEPDGGDPLVVSGENDGSMSSPDAGMPGADGGTDGGVGEPDGGGVGDNDGGVDGGVEDPPDGGTVVPVDSDGDTYAADVDCDDNSASVFQNLMGFTDIDGDRYTVGPARTICSGAVLAANFSATSLGEDCDDVHPEAHPGGVEMPYDGIDQDCAGRGDPNDLDGNGDPDDLDLDGEAAVRAGGMDCNDANPAVYRGAVDIAEDDVDQDCDGADAVGDGDGFAVTEGDCDPADRWSYPGAIETPYDDVDQDCDGEDEVDLDGDGFVGWRAGGDDCHDDDLSMHPGAEEIPYDGRDQDCVDGDLTDVDGDGVVAPEAGGNDCDDLDPRVYQLLTGYTDGDGDRYTVGPARSLCSGAVLAAGMSAESAGPDCNDDPALGGAAVHPGADDIPYDGIAQNCVADVTDADGDGFDAEIVGGTDCNDDLAYIHPGAEQRLNGIDTNCDGNLEIDLERDAVAIIGEYEGTRSGRVMAFGDVDGDGLDDALVGSPDEGRIYGILGRSGKLRPGRRLQMPEDADFILYNNETLSVGSALATADLDGDGKDDMLVGIAGYNALADLAWFGLGDGSQSGAMVIFYGREVFDAEYLINYALLGDAAALATVNMAVVKGNAGRGIGNIYTAGDINGDGVGEIIEGHDSSCDIFPALPYEGIRTKADIIASEGGYHLHDSTGTPYFGNYCDNIATGDVDGDGYTDILTADTVDEVHDAAGEVVLFLGGATLPADLNLFTLPAYEGLRYLKLLGNGPGYSAGSSLTIGDLDGDNKGEVVIGVVDENTDLFEAGKVYHIPGSAITDVVNGTNDSFGNGDSIILDGDVYLLGGGAIYGDTATASLSGYGLTAEGDSNGDGIADLLVGAGSYPVDGAVVGRAFFFDPLASMGADEVSSATATHTIPGPGGGNFGESVKGGGDVNGDGAQDVLINDPRTDGARGVTYLFCGGPAN